MMQDASWFSQTLIEKLANAKQVNTPPSAERLIHRPDRSRARCAGVDLRGAGGQGDCGAVEPGANTIRNHVATVYSKLDVHSRAEAIVWARERNLFANQGKSKR